MNEAKRFYALLPMIGNTIGLGGAGGMLIYITSLNGDLSPSAAWEINLQYLTVLMLIAGAIILYSLNF